MLSPAGRLTRAPGSLGSPLSDRRPPGAGRGSAAERQRVRDRPGGRRRRRPGRGRRQCGLAEGEARPDVRGCARPRFPGREGLCRWSFRRRRRGGSRGRGARSGAATAERGQSRVPRRGMAVGRADGLPVLPSVLLGWLSVGGGVAGAQWQSSGLRR